MKTIIVTIMASLAAFSTCTAGPSAPSRASVQVHGPRFVDIPAIVRGQVQHALGDSAASERKAVAAATRTAADTPGRFLLPMGIAIILSAIGTIVILRTMGRHGVLSAVQTYSDRVLLQQEEERLFEGAGPQSEEQRITSRPAWNPQRVLDTEPRYDSQTVRLLQSLHRGHGELSLAMKMSSDPRGGKTRDKLQRALPQVEAEDNRAQVARKFGMGKGEIDLAVHLHELQASHLRKERAE